MNRKIGFFVKTMVVCVLAIHIAAATKGSSRKGSLEYVGSALWTGMRDVALHNQMAFCSFTNGLMVLDLGDEKNPRVVSKLYLGGGSDIKLAGDTAWIAAGGQ